MSVAFNSVSTRDVQPGGTTLNGTAFTVAAGSNLAAAIMLHFYDNTVSSIAVTFGGQAATLVAGTDTTNNQASMRTMIYQAIGFAAGSRSATVSWVTTTACIMGVIVCSGVDQSTVMNGGTFIVETFASPRSVSVASNAGDLTCSICEGNDGPVTPTQTLKWGGTLIAPTTNQGGDIGTGAAGPIIHQWTDPLTIHTISGANFIQAGGASATQIAGLGKRLQGFGFYQG